MIVLEGSLFLYFVFGAESECRISQAGSYQTKDEPFSEWESCQLLRIGSKKETD